ncbi:MAG: endonuclease/exonuclease/phosphatase family protein [Solirubrobacterales bacterium]
MEVRALSWNLFHGRDHPPDPALMTWRSRLLRATERNRTHVQVNRDLLDEFAAVLEAADWDVALLQECPPRWAEPLAAATGSAAHRALTSRNSLAPLRALVARINPDLVASNEGGSNLTLVRGRITDRTELELAAGPRPERRVMALTRAVPERAGTPVRVANLHASAGPALRSAAEREVLAAAERAGAWAAGEPLIFGGDLNLRPRDSGVYAELEERFGLRGPTATGALDHLLVRGLDPLTPPHQWPPERREVTAAGLAIRLSDHAPVEASFAVPATARGPGATAK